MQHNRGLTRRDINKLALMIILTSGGGEAKDLGVYGTTFEIREENFLTHIQKKLTDLERSGKIKSHQEELIKRVQDRIERPVPIKGLQKAKSNSVKEYDPSFVLDRDIKDHEGRLIAAKGTFYNPLDIVSFGEPLLLIDGDDENHVQWALNQKGKCVLTSGSPVALERQYKRPFFFDQSGIIVKKLGIDEIPAMVSQSGNKLRIDMFLIKGEKNDSNR